MKQTSTAILLVGLFTAFAVVSLLVWLSKGENKRAVKAKFRLGGAIIALTAAVSTTSCTSTCYDPADPNYVRITSPTNNSINNGDYIVLTAKSVYDFLSFEIVDANNNSLQKEFIKAKDAQDNVYFLVLNVGDYSGEVNIQIFGESDGEEIHQDQLLHGQQLNVNAKKD